jgi:hypothetical protein
MVMLQTLLVDLLKGKISETITRIPINEVKSLIKIIDNEIKNNEIVGGQKSIEYIDKYKKIKILLKERNKWLILNQRTIR